MFVRQRLSRLSRPSSLWCRYNSGLPPLPPLEEWKSRFPVHEIQGRVSLKNQRTADHVANAFLPEKEDGEGKIVIEAYPGPGVLTRSLLSLPPNRLKKLIILEEEPCFLEYLHELQRCDPRVTIVPAAGFSWSSYSTVESLGLLEDVQPIPWEEGESNLQFISHIPNTVFGDQIVAQFFRSIPERTWLFKHGRVQMSFVLRNNLWERVCSGPGTNTRCKLGVIAEAVSKYKQAVSMRALLPYNENFFPPPPVAGRSTRMDRRAIGQPFTAVNIFPMANSHIHRGLLDKWDFITRHLFVLKSTTLKKAIGSLAFGATNLLKPLTDPSLPKDQQVDPNKKICELSVREWELIVKAFDEWPFAPDNLCITDQQYIDIERD